MPKSIMDSKNSNKGWTIIIGHAPNVENLAHVGINEPLNPIIVDLNLYWQMNFYHAFEFFI